SISTLFNHRLFSIARVIVWANLSHQKLRVYLPFLCTGLLAWNMVATIMSEGCVTFVAAEGLIKQLRFPYSILACSVAWRNVIVFLHNLVILVALALYTGLRPTWATLLAIP